MKPVLQAILVADRVYQTDNGRPIIAAIFHQIRLRQTDAIGSESVQTQSLPIDVAGGSPYYYLGLTDVIANTKITLQMNFLDANCSVFEKEVIIPEDCRLKPYIRFEPLPANNAWLQKYGPGVYSLDLYWEGELLGSHRLTAVLDKQD